MAARAGGISASLSGKSRQTMGEGAKMVSPRRRMDRIDLGAESLVLVLVEDFAGEPGLCA